MENEKPVESRTLSPAPYLFAAVLFLRVIVLFRLTGSLLLLPQQGDMHFYSEWAVRILHGKWTDHTAFYGLPLYPFVLAVFYAVFGFGPFVPALFQICCDAGTAVLLYRIGRQVFRNEAVGIIAALSWGVFQPAAAYSVILMPTAASVFAFWWLTWRIIKSKDCFNAKQSMLFGVVIGFLAMGIATILFLIPLFLAAFFFQGKMHGYRAALTACTLFCGVALGSSPCWLHNVFIAHDPVFLSAHSGVNFWIGNNPEATGYPHFPPGLRASQQAMLRDSIATAEKAARHTLKHSEVSAFWSAKARAYIAEQTGDWVRLLLAKIRNFWSAFCYDDLSVITVFRDEGILNPGLGFGLAAALGLPGLVFAWRRWPLSRWITAAVFLQMLALLPVFVTERYRLAAAPGILLGAAWISVEIWKQLMARRYFRSVALATCVVVVAWFVSWPLRDPSLWALDDYNSGWNALENNKLQLAEHRLLRAYAYVPGNSEINFAIGNLRLAQGNPTSAVSFYLTTLQLNPQHPGAFNNLGLIALEGRHFEQAVDLLGHSIRQDPDDAKTHYLLATAYLRIGKKSEALSEIAIALRLDPKQPAFAKLRDEIL